MKHSIRSTFLIIQMFISLLLVFLIIQGFLVWRVGEQGVQTIHSLEQEGVPSMTHVAAFKQNLNLYRLHSYELMFVQEKERPAKAAEADGLHRQNIGLLGKLKQIFPEGEGHQRVAAVDTNLAAYASAMEQMRLKMDKDFQGAMQMLDQDIPARVTQLNNAVTNLAGFCDKRANDCISRTAGSFSSINLTAVGFGTGSIIFCAIVVFMVTLNSGRIRRELAHLVGQLSEGSNRVHDSGSSVASASQSLAEGSSEQAASLEETSASLEEMASMTQRNAENAQKANDLARGARNAADKGATDMQAMATAMDAIKASSDDIAKIIKTIDEIAFQTNILALNAAVEAARAGEAGMGFAVVADEVRSLAQRSAQAAKDTAAMIESAIAKTTQGVEINAKVGTALTDIVTKARQVDELVAEIAQASKEQSQGIVQINSAVTQMDKVTQHNAANAEESAAAAQELRAQSQVLRKAVTELQQLVGGQNQKDSQRASDKEPTKASPVPVRKPSVASSNGSHANNGHDRHAAPKPAQTTAGTHRRGDIPMGDDFKDF
jgi:methyl-accepting chemotaxis protein